jgi:DNA-binding MarR family transcriptional regulator
MENQTDVPIDRDQTLTHLSHAMQLAGALGTMFGQVVADQVGMNATDLECLDFLIIYGPMPAGRLAELSGLTTGAITGVVDRLEAAGYVQRERDPDDRRRVILRPQPGRFGPFEPYYGPLYHVMNDLMARYDDAELALLLDYYQEINRIFTEQIARVREMGETPKKKRVTAGEAAEKVD